MQIGVEKFIDIEKVIASKNPRLLKWMPGFLLRYVKRILHEADVNAFMRAHGHHRGVDFATTVLSEFHTTVIVKGLEHLPEHGGFIVASNHPLGGFDGLALIAAVAEKRKDIRFLVNDLLLNFKNLEEIFIPVNKHGSQYAFERIEQTYRSEHAILIFPAGLVSRKQDGKIRDLEWKKSFISKATQYQKPVVPAFIDGKNSSFFYNLALFRKKLGIKANLEMFYLGDEMYKQQNKTITIIFDKPVNPAVFDNSKSHREWAALMKEHVYSLGEGKPGPFTNKNSH
jgi:1-acyl-sn-glycerol-3-phosphate acyltransferase